MPSRKRTSSVLNGAADQEPGQAATPDPALALELAEAEAEAAEAEAVVVAARARARALKLRRRAEEAAASTRTATEVTDADDADDADDVDDADEPAAIDGPQPASAAEEATNTEATEATEATDDGDDEVDAPARRRLQVPRVRPRVAAAALVVVLVLGFLGASAWMTFQHRRVAAEQQRSAEFAAAARQGVVTLMSLNFTSAADDVKRIIDSSTGDFKKDFESQAADFTKAAQESKVVTEANVNAIAVKSMTQDTAMVLVAVTTNVSNAASKDQQPRSWRLNVQVARDGGQIKLAKVEFVP